ncbi:MAG: dTMP kinase, partial [Gemmatimonadaceae bacterium]
QISATTEALLFMASRSQVVSDEIDPALDRGVVVLMDRFFLSTYAYQIDGRGLPEDQIRSANALAASGLVPDLTIVIQFPAAEGMSRAGTRGSPDRMERSGDAFHGRVERAFDRFTSGDWQSAHRECGPIVAVDGRGSVDEVHARLIEALATHLPDPFVRLTTHGDSHQC